MKAEKAGIADIEVLVRLRLEFLREDNGGLEDPEAEAIARGLPGYFKAHIDKDLFVYVVRESAGIVSCAFLITMARPMSPAFLNGRCGTVMNVYTAPSFRRRGYARTIMKAMLKDAKDMELSRIELKATQDGYPLYRSLGFTEEGPKYQLMVWKDRKAP